MNEEVKYVITKLLENGNKAYIKGIVAEDGFSVQNVLIGSIIEADKFDHYEDCLEKFPHIEYPGYYQIDKVFHLTTKEPQ